MSASVYARTAYTDVALLALMQKAQLERLAEEGARCMTDQVKVQEVVSLEGRMIEFRQRLWFQHVSEGSTVPAKLLKAAQRQHHLPELLDALNRDVSDASRYLAAQEAVGRQEELERRLRLERRITAAAAVFAAPALVFTATATAVQPSWQAFGVSTGISMVLALVAFLMARRFGDRRRMRRSEEDS